MPALVATVTGDNGLIEDVQRIWLDPERPAKGPISLRPRKAFGRVHGRAVRFGGSPVNGGAKLVHPGGTKLVHLMLCGTRCWGVVPVVHRRDPRCFV